MSMSDLLNNDYRVFFVSPEELDHKTRSCANMWLSDDVFVSRLVAVVIDEAHLFYEWGISFRRAWGDLASLLARVSEIPKLFLSATMTQYAKQSIINAFNFEQNPYKIIEYPDSLSRSNLFISLRPINNKDAVFDSIKLALELDLNCEQIQSPADIPLSIIYLDSKRICARLLSFLNHWVSNSTAASHFHNIVAMYHADCTEASRDRIYDRIMEGTTRIVVATECLGMVCPSLFYFHYPQLI